MSNPNLGELFTQVWQKINQMKLHVCLSGEYNVTTLVPTVDYPEENTFYLVPDGSGNNVYTEWVYVNDNWERFGQASIDLSDYVQKTDYATGTNVGLVKTISTLGLYISPGDGTLNVAKATDEQVKAGTQIYKPITPVNQHMATFYGLAKAAGDATQAASENVVGTYTDEAKAAIHTMLGLGVASTSKLGLVKTAGLGIGINSSGELSTSKASTASIKSGTNNYYVIVPSNTPDAVFYGLAKAAGDSTQTASDNEVGTYTASAKAAINMMLGSAPAFTPIFTGTVLLGTAANAHDLSADCLLIGTNNQAGNGDAIAIGINCNAGGGNCIAVGNTATSLGANSAAIGSKVSTTGAYSFANGYYTEARGAASHAEGNISLAAGVGSHAEGMRSIANGRMEHVEGKNNLASITFDDWAENTEYAVGTIVIHGTQRVRCVEAHTSTDTYDSTKWEVPNEYQDTSTKYVHVIGNGLSNTVRGNAYALDWEGNGYFNGDVYVECNSDGTGGNKLISEADYATDTTPGVVKIAPAHGIGFDSDNLLYLTAPNDAQIRALSNGYYAVKLNQADKVTFYSLAKAAGDTTQSISNNAVGLYTDNAKAAIKSMLGIIPDPPSTVGTYTLQAVVTNDGITYNWIVET